MTDKELFEKIRYKSKNVYNELSGDEAKKMYAMCDEYREYLDNGKTERECVKISEKMALENGFVSVEEKEKLAPGDKVYFINRDKNILLAVIGEEK